MATEALLRTPYYSKVVAFCCQLYRQGLSHGASGPKKMRISLVVTFPGGLPQ